MTDEKPAEIDIAKLEAVSIRVHYIHLTNGMVFQVNDPWPGPDGSPCAKGDIDGESRHIKIGAIFFVPEKTELVEFEGEGNNENSTIPAHYEVWTEPCTEPRMFRVWKDQVFYEEMLVPMQHAFETLHVRLLDMLTVDPDEVAEPESEAEETPPLPATTESAPS